MQQSRYSTLLFPKIDRNKTDINNFVFSWILQCKFAAKGSAFIKQSVMLTLTNLREKTSLSIHEAGKLQNTTRT